MCTFPLTHAKPSTVLIFGSHMPRNQVLLLPVHFARATYMYVGGKMVLHINCTCVMLQHSMNHVGSRGSNCTSLDVDA